MRRNPWPLKPLLLLAVLIPSGLGAQQNPPPPVLRALPGYEVKRLQGIDTAVGELRKGDRVVLRYDIGRLAGIRLDTPEKRQGCIFYEERVVHGQHARYCVHKGGWMEAFFVESNASFYGQTEG